MNVKGRPFISERFSEIRAKDTYLKGSFLNRVIARNLRPHHMPAAMSSEATRKT